MTISTTAPTVALVSHIYLEPRNRGKLAWIARRTHLTVIVPNQFFSAYGSDSYDGRQGPNYALRAYPCVFPTLVRSSTRWILGSLDLGLRAIRPDIVQIENEVHSFSVLQGLLCRALFARSSKVVVFAWANIEVPGLKGLLLRALARLASPHIDHFIVGNQAGRRLLLEDGVPEERISVMPVVGIDQSLFVDVAVREQRARRDILGIAPDELVVGFVGRFVPEKGIADLLAAYRLLRSALAGRKLRLLFVGDGPLKAQLRAQGSDVIVISPGGRAKTLEYYSVMDVLALPSRTTSHWAEQFGLVLAEAMASGVPVVGSDSGAIPEVIGDAGHVFPEGDVRALARALGQVLAAPATRAELTRRGRERARAFTDEAIASATIALYARLASDGPAQTPRPNPAVPAVREGFSGAADFAASREEADATRRSRCPICDGAAIRPYLLVPRRYGGSAYQLNMVRCSSCGFVFIAEAPAIAYDENYLRLEGVITTDDALAEFRANERLASIARLVPPAPEKAFLDIGVGDGLLLSMAEKAGYTTFGLDVNAAGVALARRQFGLRASISLEPFERAFPFSRFHVIHMNEVIEHIPEPMPLFRWCRSHLEPSGFLVVQTGNIDSLVSRVTGAAWPYIRPVHVSYFSTRTLSQALGNAGLTVRRRATNDWRLRPSLRAGWALLRSRRVLSAVRFLLLFATSKIPGVRRGVLVYASPAAPSASGALLPRQR